jgi:hypothetical protein
MRICPVDRQWLHTHFLEPPLEGIARLRQALWGKDVYSLAQTPFNLKERVICWLVGTALLIPFANNLIWFFWQILGSPEKLSDPLCPEEPAPQRHQRAPSSLPVSPASLRRPAEEFEYSEDFEGVPVNVHLRLERSASLLVATQTCESFSSKAIYGEDGITSYYYKDGKKIVEVSRNGNRVECILPTKKTFTLEEGTPWIQQPTIGLKSFILSDQKELDFYGFLFEDPRPWYSGPDMPKLKAVKGSIEEVAGLGKLLKVEVITPYSLSRSGKLWFNEAGVLVKFIEPSMRGSSERGGVLLQHHPLPAPGRP